LSNVGELVVSLRLAGYEEVKKQLDELEQQLRRINGLMQPSLENNQVALPVDANEIMQILRALERHLKKIANK